MSFLSYFDLNKRSVLVKGSPDAGLSEVMNMNREKTPDSESKKMERTENDKYSMSLWEQISTYLGIVVGVLFSSAAMQMKSGISAQPKYFFHKYFIVSCYCLCHFTGCV